MSCLRCLGTNISPQTRVGDGKGFHDQALRRVVPKPWLSSQGGVHSHMKGFILVVAQRTPLSSGRIQNLSWLHDRKYKKKMFCFCKKKGYRYEDKLGSKKITTVPQQRGQKACWHFLTQTERFYKSMQLLL
jgi:hypothetical protein